MLTIDYLNKNPSLWKYVFYPHTHIGWRSNCAGLAEKAQYKYFVWNDIIYTTNEAEATKEMLKKCLPEVVAKEVEVVEYSGTATYQVGDKFLLDGNECVITQTSEPTPVLDYFVTQIMMSPSYCGYISQGLWELRVETQFKKYRGSAVATYHLKKDLIPQLGDFKTNEAWYKQLLKVLKENEI